MREMQLQYVVGRPGRSAYHRPRPSLRRCLDGHREGGQRGSGGA